MTEASPTQAEVLSQYIPVTVECSHPDNVKISIQESLQGPTDDETMEALVDHFKIVQIVQRGEPYSIYRVIPERLTPETSRVLFLDETESQDEPQSMPLPPPSSPCPQSIEEQPQENSLQVRESEKTFIMKTMTVRLLTNDKVEEAEEAEAHMKSLEQFGRNMDMLRKEYQINKIVSERPNANHVVYHYNMLQSFRLTVPLFWVENASLFSGVSPSDLQEEEMETRKFLLSMSTNRVAIIMEDAGTQSMMQLIPEDGFSVLQFLNYAIQLSKAIGTLHLHNVIHRNIRPENIVVDMDSHKLTLIDFSQAQYMGDIDIEQSVNTRATAAEAPNSISSLAYISPEQTYRLNRGVDYRTDIYSLGVTLYHMITGQLPFDSDLDPMGLIHCHITKQPEEPISVCAKSNKLIPQMISDIIMKLMKKDPSERYQSSGGLLFDLELCQRCYRSSFSIPFFELAIEDRSNHFPLPFFNLYGREKEIRAIMHTFHHVSVSGLPEAIFVVGNSGIGKSSLIYEAQRQLLTGNSYCVSGKFDQLDRNVAYSAIGQAFRMLIQIVLTEPEDRLTMWKNKLLSVLGVNGQLVINIIPELQNLIGDQPSVQSMGVSETRLRFNSVFSNFVSVFAKDCTLTLSIDDLQRADAASLNLIEMLLTNDGLEHFVFIGSYRDTEVNNNYPVLSMIEELKRSDVRVTTIHLYPLTLEHVKEWIADLLYLKESEVSELAEHVYTRTEGNPFFVKCLIQSIYDAGFLTKSTRWEWDMENVRSLPPTASLVDLLIQKLGKFQEETIETLKIASCFGCSFQLSYLAKYLQIPSDSLIKKLKPAFFAGLAFVIENDFCFSHDKVQDAIYSQISKERKGVIHFKIGCILLDNREPEEISDDICDITDQFNHSLDEIDRIPNFKEETTVFKLSRMNYYAALKMINSIAYHSALTYLLTSARLLSMLGDEDYLWEHYYSFCFNLHKNLALTYFYNDKFSDSTKMIDLLLEKTKCMIDLAEVLSARITLLTSQMKLEESLVCGLEALCQMGVYIPQSEEEMEREIELEQEALFRTLKHYRTIIPDMDARVNYVTQSIKTMDDPKSKAICDVSNSMTMSMYWANHSLYRLFSLRAVNMSFEKGEAPTAPHSFASVGAILVESMKHMMIAKELFMIALKLAERNPAQKCIVYHAFAACGAHWFFHKNYARKYCSMALESGKQTGNLFWSGCIEANISLNMFYCSAPIDDVLATYSKNHRFVSKSNNLTPYYILKIMVLLLHKLIGRRCKLSRSELDASEETLVRDLDASNLSHARHIYYTFKIFQYVLDESRDCWSTAYQFVIEAEKIEMVKDQYIYVWLTFYPTLVCLNIIDKLQEGLSLLHPVPTIDELWRRIDQSLERMKFWMKYCPSNFQHMHELMLAEYLRMKGDKWEAARCYDDSISHAAQNGFTHDEAIAAEFAFRFWKKNNREEIARIYLKRAFESYKKWGATWKLEQMLQVYPEILENMTPADLLQYQRTDTSVSNVNLALLDLDRVIKASQIISSTIDIEQLLFNVMKIIIEIGHAQKGAIIINGNIEAEYSTADDNDVYQILHSTPLNLWEHGCRDIINHVQSTHETVVLSSAIDDPQFGSNSYIVQNKCKSILCAPVILQNKLLAILYMENNLISDVFSEHRMTVLNILTSQMAISLENAISFKDRLESAQKIAEVERKRAEDAETYKKNLELFVDSICHEIRNPIFGIYGNLDHLRTIVDRLSNEVGRKSIAEMREALKSIDICTTHQKAITDDVLTLSKLESNMVQLNRKVFNPNLMISSIVSMFEVEVSNKHLKLITKMPEQDKSVYGDSTRISQVIINLMSNSVKFSSEGTITLSLDVQPEHNSDNIKLSFCVEDTGLGMSEKEIEHLFHRFTQGTRTEKEYSGSGLGMYISKHLVELMGGEIKVDSKKGAGTRVYFYVYCQKPPETRNEVSVPQDNKNEKDESETRSLRVLIVEDNKINQTILKRFLTQRGHSVQVANNGSEACDVFKTMIHNPFDVIFMDIEMPIMNGLEATRVIREIEANSHIERTPIIGISGNARSLHADMAKEAGMNQYITKPVSKEQIYRVISTVVPPVNK